MDVPTTLIYLFFMKKHDAYDAALKKNMFLFYHHVNRVKDYGFTWKKQFKWKHLTPQDAGERMVLCNLKFHHLIDHEQAITPTGESFLEEHLLLYPQLSMALHEFFTLNDLPNLMKLPCTTSTPASIMSCHLCPRTHCQHDLTLKEFWYLIKYPYRHLPIPESPSSTRKKTKNDKRE